VMRERQYKVLLSFYVCVAQATQNVAVLWDREEG
jgi:hypothetical protein